MISILIVDGRDAARAPLRELLTSREYRIAEAADAAEALRLLSSETPDLVVAGSAPASGYELVRLMRSVPDSAQIPVLMANQPPLAGMDQTAFPAQIFHAIEGCLPSARRNQAGVSAGPPASREPAETDQEADRFSADLIRIGAQLSAPPRRVTSFTGSGRHWDRLSAGDLPGWRERAREQSKSDDAGAGSERITERDSRTKALACLEALTARRSGKPGTAGKLLQEAAALLCGGLEADEWRVTGISREGNLVPSSCSDPAPLLSASLASQALSSGAAVVTADPAEDSRFPERCREDEPALANTVAVKVEWCGRVRAVIEVSSRVPRAFRPGQVALLRSGASMVARTLERDAKARSRRRARKRLRQMIASGPAAIYCLHLDGGILRPVIVGDNIEKVTGSSLRQAKQPEWWRKHAGADDTLRRAAESLARGESRLTREYELARADGTSVWVRDEARVFLGKPGAPLEIIGALTDITESKAMEEELRRARVAESFSQLAGGIAHDYNNLLTVIAGFAWLELADTELRPGQRHAMEAISKAAEAAIALTGKLEMFARPRGLEKRILAPEAIIDNLLVLVRAALARDVSLRTHVAAGLPTVEVDQGAIEKALLHLVLSARDLTPGGGETEIRICPVTLRQPDSTQGSSRRAGDFLCFEVRVPRDKAPVPSAVQALVSRCGGWVEVEWDARSGSLFRVFLPAAGSTWLDVASPARLPGQPSILLVEDDEPVCALIEMFLSKWGYRVLVADSFSAAEAILDAPDRRVDLMVTEVALRRGVSGLQLGDRARELRPGLPVVYTSAQPLPREPGAHQGRDFLRKPFELAILASAIDRGLGSRATGAGG